MRAPVVVTLAFVVAVSLPGLATTVEPLDDQALVARSDLIAVVVVTGVHAERVGRRVFTFYDLDVADVWRSRDQVAPANVVLAVPGGVVDVEGRSLGQAVAGMPVLVVGRTYVLCLGDDVGPRGARGIVGLWQGAFAVLEGLQLRAFAHGGPAAQTIDGPALRARLTSPAREPR